MSTENGDMQDKLLFGCPKTVDITRLFKKVPYRHSCQTERAYGNGKVLHHAKLFAEKEISNYLKCCTEGQQFNEKGLKLLKNWLHTKNHTDLNKLLDQTERLFSGYYRNVNGQAGQSL